MEETFEEETWKVINQYFNDNKYFLTNHQIESFNDFISSKIPLTIKQFNPLQIYKEKDSKTGDYKYEINIYFGGYDGDQINISKPIIYDKNNANPIKQMFPNEARLRNLNYSSSINCNIDIDFFIKDSGTKTKISKRLENINIGKIPIMLHSNYCILNNQPSKLLLELGESQFEQGGYFIINGKEKVIISQERMAVNKLYLAKKNSDSIFSYVSEIKSVPEKTFQIPKTISVKMLATNNTILVSIPNINKNVPLFILFRALGLESDKEIIEHIFPDYTDEIIQTIVQKLRPSINETGPIFCQKDALNYLATLTRFRTVEHIQYILINDFLPHINSTKGKIFYLGHMVNQLLKMTEHIIKPTDRDSFSFKRVDLPGFLLAEIFREYYLEFLQTCREGFRMFNFNKNLYGGENIVNIVDGSNKFKLFNPNKIENGFLKSLKGNWGTKDDPSKQGVVQDLSRLSFLGSISHLRRVHLPMVSSTKLVPPRRLHGSTWGIMCPVETPDGGNIGCIKHFSISAGVTFGSSSGPVLEALNDNDLISINQIIPDNIIGNTKIFVNGNMVGVHENAEILVNKLKLLRRNACIHPHTSIIWDITNMSLNINTDTGRCIRPLYIVNNNKLLLNDSIISKLNNNDINWNQLIHGFISKDEITNYSTNYIPTDNFKLKKGQDIENYLETNQGIIEYIDVEEAESLLIASNYSQLTTGNINPYTHCEIHPSLILGVMGQIIPFVEHNQAPRNLFSAGQSKQSVGLYTSNFRYRLDQTAYLLSYPQRPLITTRMMKYIAEEKITYGENTIVAIASYNGYNQEDALIFNRSSLQRGLFRTTYIKTYFDKEENNANTKEQSNFGNPIEIGAKNIKQGKNYNLINKFGFPERNEYVTDKDIIIGKVNKVTGDQGDYYIDSSITPKKNTHGFIERVFIDSNEEDILMSKICIREERVPEIGDKFSSRHGQKGTIGIVINQEDMPYTKDGIVPDLIVNPHAIPSRMTIGQLLECVIGKVSAVEGFISDATPFTNASDPIETVGNYLEEKCNYERNSNEIMYNGMTGDQIGCSIFIGPTYYMRLKHLVNDKMQSRAEGSKMTLTRQPPGGKAREGGLRLGEMERDAILSHGIASFLKESFYDRADGYTINISKKTGRIVPVNKNKNIYPEEEYSTIKVPYTFKLLIQELEAMCITPRLITTDK
jgi:DNA-directed RNA polymerase II subunit RPB2